MLDKFFDSSVGLVELIESGRNYVTLQHAEASMASQPLLKICRSCLVNMSRAREISRTPRGDVIVLLAGGAIVTSSERFRESVREELHRLQMWPRES